MYDVRACRGCLDTKGKLENMTDLTKNMFATITGLKISYNDGMPLNFCIECHTKLKNLLTFRRRCRRAYFVMKEIISVEKQITIKNIMMVSRKRTNLQSQYEYNKGQNCAYFTINTTEPNIETIIENLDKYQPGETVELVQQEGENSMVSHIDIEPVQTSPPAPVEEMKTEAIDTNEDIQIKEELETMEIATEEESESELNSSIEEVKEIENEREKKSVPCTRDVIQNSLYLAHTDIKYLEFKEQREAFLRRMDLETFRTAKYKCTLCIRAFETMQELLIHIDIHNKCVSFPIVCKVCKMKFENDEDFTIHSAVTHMYEYKCKRCDAPPLYTLKDIISHHQFHPRLEVKESRIERIRQHYDLEHSEMTMTSSTAAKYGCRCGMKFLNPKLLEAHAARHIKVRTKPLQCNVCGVYYNGPRSLDLHIQMMHMYIYICKQCPSRTYNIQEAEHHLHSHGRKPPQYLCEFCDQMFRTKRKLNNHRRNAHYAETHPHHCNLCGISESKAELLYQHQLSSHGYISINGTSKYDEWFCEICNFQFSNLNAYKIHAVRYRHEEASAFENVCLFCVQVFNTAEEYQNHFQNSCRKMNSFKCPYCDEVMVNRKIYKLHHKKMHPSDTYRPMGEAKLCEQCGVSVTDLYEHVKLHKVSDVDVVAYVCSICFPQRYFKDVRRYASHVVRSHARRPYWCTLCPAKFRWCSECRDHILKTHSPVQPYKCEICDEQFSHGEFLQEHYLNAHRKTVEIPRPDMKNTISLWVYPHMKLNLSLLDQSVLPNFTLELWDYLHEKREVLRDFREFVVLDFPDGGPRKRRKEDTVRVTEVVECLEDIEVVMQNGVQFVNVNGVLYKIKDGGAGAV